jgi:hypothetical protein
LLTMMILVAIVIFVYYYCDYFNYYIRL